MGFIGSVLTETLIKQGHDVVGYDRNGPPSRVGYTCIDGDILDYERMRDVIPDNLRLIIHLAAEHADEGPTREDYFRINDLGTQRILEIAEQKNIKQFLFFSSAAVYGNQNPASEDTPPMPINDYGESKLAAEKRITEWVNKDPSRYAIILRPSVVYGPHNKANIYRLIKQVYHGKFSMVGRGKNIKSVAFINNVVAATSYLLDKFENRFEILNLSDYPQLSIREFVSLIEKHTPKRILSLGFPLWIAIRAVILLEISAKLLGKEAFISRSRLLKFVSESHIESDKIRRWGFKQPFTIEEGVIETIRWNVQHGWKDTS